MNRFNQIFFLKAAAVVTFLYFAGHTWAIPWTPDESLRSLQVVGGMKTAPVEIMGAVRTYWSFYFGFGLMISLFLLTQAVVIWQLAILGKSNFKTVRPAAWTFLIASMINAYLAARYLFWIPTTMAAIVSLCLLGALFIRPFSKKTRTR